MLAFLDQAGTQPYVEAQVHAAMAEAHAALGRAVAVPESHRMLGELLNALVRNN